jgi:hypothetical protein
MTPNANLHLLPEAGATQERRLEAVRCKALLRLSKNPKTEKISTHNSFVFKSRFSMKMPKLDFFDSLVRRRSATDMCL